MVIPQIAKCAATVATPTVTRTRWAMRLTSLNKHHNVRKRLGNTG